MKQIKDLGQVEYGTQGRTTKRAIFECPICLSPFETNVGSVRLGKTKKCRHCADKVLSKSRITHGGYQTRLYNIWGDMKSRCKGYTSKSKRNYTDRGVIVCEEWGDYISFKKWATLNGYSDELTIDRIDSRGNYEPSNCRFISLSENSRRASKRENYKNNPNIKLTPRDVIKILELKKTSQLPQTEIAKMFSVTPQAIHSVLVNTNK